MNNEYKAQNHKFKTYLIPQQTSNKQTQNELIACVNDLSYHLNMETSSNNCNHCVHSL